MEHDQLGRKVIVMRSGIVDPLLHKPEDVEKVSFMVGEVMAKDDEQFPITGIVVIIDMEGFTLDHLTHRPLSITKKQMKFLTVFGLLLIIYSTIDITMTNLA